MAKTAVLLLLAVWLVTPQSATAEETRRASDLNVLKEAIERTVAALSGGKAVNALEELMKEHWYSSSEAASTAAALRAQLEAGVRTGELRLGKRIRGAYEFLGVRRLGKSLTKFVYVQKHEHYVIPLVFDCYKAEREWKITGIGFGDNAVEDMKAFAVVEPHK